MYKILAKTLFMGKTMVFLPECHSTNIEASKLLERYVHDGTIVITNNQTAGKGQRGNVWTAQAGKNLTFTLILKPAFLEIKNQFFLNKAVSLGIHDFVERELTETVRIKWPNDILVNDKKVCGILIENSVSGHHLNHSIIGIGLNLNQKDFEYPEASSLVTFSNREFDLQEALENLIECIESRYLELKNRKFEKISSDYLESLYWIRETRKFRSGSENFEGRIIGDDHSGKLIIETSSGLRTFGTKEVEYIR